MQPLEIHNLRNSPNLQHLSRLDVPRVLLSKPWVLPTAAFVLFARAACTLLVALLIAVPRLPVALLIADCIDPMVLFAAALRVFWALVTAALTVLLRLEVMGFRTAASCSGFLVVWDSGG